MKFSNKQTFKLALALFACCNIFYLSSCNKSENFDENSASRVNKASTIKSTNRFFILPKGNSFPSNIENEITKAGGKFFRNYSDIGAITAISDDPSFASKMAKVSGVGKVIRDYKINYLTDPSDKRKKFSSSSLPPNSTSNTNPFYNVQWNMNAINAEGAWDAGQKGNGAKVAVLDCGVYMNHPDIKNNINTSWSKNFVVGESLEFNFFDPFSHATHVGGIIAAEDNNEGVIGVAPEAELYFIKVISDNGWGNFSDVISGILYAAAVDVNDTSFYRNPNYHRLSDTPETLNYEKMAEVVNGVYHALLKF